jgi:hypothetical protein
MLKGEFENDSRQSRDLLRNRQSNSLKKSQLTLSQGMLKREDDGDEVDDEVRTTVPSQKGATATLRAAESFLRTQYSKLSPHISREVWGVGNRQSKQY